MSFCTVARFLHGSGGGRGDIRIGGARARGRGNVIGLTILKMSVGWREVSGDRQSVGAAGAVASGGWGVFFVWCWQGGGRFVSCYRRGWSGLVRFY